MEKQSDWAEAVLGGVAREFWEEVGNGIWVGSSGYLKNELVFELNANYDKFDHFIDHSAYF